MNWNLRLILNGVILKKARSPLKWWTSCFFWAVEFKNSEPKQGSLVMMAREKDWFFLPKIMCNVASMGWKVHLIEFNLKDF